MRAWPSDFVHRKADIHPDRIPDVAPGAGLVVDRLAYWDRPARLAQYESPDRWALDVTTLFGKLSAGGHIYAHSAVVLFVMEGESATLCGKRLTDNCIFILPPGSGLDVNFTRSFVYSSPVLSPDEWARAHAYAHGGGPDFVKSAMRPLPMSPAAALQLRHSLRLTTDLLDHAESRENASNAFFEFVAGLADASVEIDQPKRAGNRAVDARRAQDYIRAHIKQPISMRRLCEHVGVSRRQVEYAFHDTLGVGPREFTHALRLNEVRRRLLQARGNGASVTDVAFEFGINHLGRFSASYRRLFGEAPSETLRSSRYA